MPENAIELHNVSKRFKLYHNSISGPVKELLFFWKSHNYYQEFLAVKGVSLTIEKGETVGIIGPNGAGKTTLLKMIAGLLAVDEGKVIVNGKITALLALGIGVHPEFTGRENIYYGGMLIGMSREEVLLKTPNIIEFAELGDFIDRPFRTYSSGMKARLLFAISMSIDPDILIVDEALASGDTYFVNKCSQRIREICKSGATIIFVSHNLTQIEQLCQRAFFMAEGQMLNDGHPSKIVTQYHRWVFDKDAQAPLITEQPELESISGTKDVIITDIKLKSANGRESTGFFTGENMCMEIYYNATAHATNEKINLFIGFKLCNSGQYVGEIQTRYNVDSLMSQAKQVVLDVYQKGMIEITFNPLLLLNNHYALWIIIESHDVVRYCEYTNVSPFFVSRRDRSIARGPIFLQPAKIATKKQ